MTSIEVVAAILEFEDYFLCVQRPENATEHNSLKWEFPGGKVELGENREQALKREIREELDVEIENLEYLTTVEHTYPDFHLVMHAYTCSISRGEPVLKEHVALKWLTVEDLDQLDWAAADIPIVENLMSGRG
mgnify:CR=1 FL=1